ncbi:alpha/beta-hydrolase [Patellaria atrata CBS 101060]|uniref:Alpha/beta-hydrolase n=1 Tax=Patellaria atrata CBS 101060 TaxID=1346257 RepID=A0A9P4S5K4_9PEZI|nr:alpha/beta-hydrolase [Patellaria atrata CBS 101060]
MLSHLIAAVGFLIISLFPEGVRSESAQYQGGICKDVSIPITVTSENFVWGLPTFKDNFDVAEILFEVARDDSAEAFHPFIGTRNETATYRIEGTVCTPMVKTQQRENTLLIATHGLGYDRRYWASTYKPKDYNFVEKALKIGYSIFFYDRLGTGKSQKISGFSNQLANQVELLAALCKGFRSGGLIPGFGSFKQIVLVGHSYGSSSTQGVAQKYPDIIDGLVLTGIAYYPPPDAGKITLEAFAPRIAKTVDPQFSDRDNGYLAFRDIHAHAQTFFKQPNYEIGAVEYAQSIANPFGIAEFLSLFIGGSNASPFLGPVLVSLLSKLLCFQVLTSLLVTTGEFDLIVCGGECNSVFARDIARSVFPRASVVEPYVHPGVGHGVNFGKNATGLYDVIIDFLENQGF